MATCEKNIQKTSSWGKGKKIKCGKVAITKIGELHVCQKCFNKWDNKNKRASLRKISGMTNSQLNQAGLISNNGKLITYE